ncbi:serine/threonine protein kinase [Dictyobacter kobayashii]|uniref:Protein kinase domain-containing protein n=1 Tax=Dictyobacter kobayashii TaxID=2014872 RepID=A0A402AW01_9CHLR|nr:serine/threonine-protein kinase [Dictyobacter kobayashii]GCE23259.1 hypothetical protein KDK_70590 [Dictyobacter kobayashii]
MQNSIGQQIGNYKIHQMIGRGGYAEVHLGEHLFLRKQAAIKLLHAQLADTLAIQNFHHEAQLISQLNHPHIVRVLEFGVAENIPYLAMEYASNGTLRQLHPRGSQLTLETILAYVTQLGAAIQYAHDHKLVHRDIKPDNILLTANNDLLLSDFGIALIQATTQQSTKEAIGTVAYMAPEQLQGKPCFASDQYALGIMIYEWISGTTPFQGSPTEVCTQHMFTPPSSLKGQIPTLSAEVEQVIFKALAKEPKERFPTIQGFVDAFRDAMHNSTKQVWASPITQTEHAQKTISTPTATTASYNPPYVRIAATQTITTEGSLTDWIISHIVYPLGYIVILYLFLLVVGFFAFGLKKDLFTNTPSIQIIAMTTGTFAVSCCTVIFAYCVMKRRS